MKPEKYFVFDVESVGLHGEAFAVGWVVVNLQGEEESAGILACDPENARGTDDGRAWVKNHVPLLPYNCSSPLNVRNYFWRIWQMEKDNGAVMAADCLWPVEARFLIECVNDNPVTREWQGPYPFIDVASILLAAGHDPLGSNERLPNELPQHDPMADARQSARLLIQYLKK